MLQSGSFVSLGAGDPVQRRDRARARDAEGRIQVDPLEPPEALDDSVDLLFADLVDWSIVDRSGYSPYRYNEREVVRAWAENCPATRQFLMDNHVRFARINGTHSGGGMSRARGRVCFLMLGDRTDMRAGTITAEDAGRANPERRSAFAPVQMDDASRVVGPGAFEQRRGAGATARVLGAREGRAVHVEPRVRRAGPRAALRRSDPRHRGELVAAQASRNRRAASELLAERQHRRASAQLVRIRARRGVVLASGGHAGNPEVRSMFHPGMREPMFLTSGSALLGPRVQDASAHEGGPQGRRQSGRHASEPEVSIDVPHLDPPRHARPIHADAAGSSHVRIPRIHRHQRRRRRLPGPHRRQPGGQALLQRDAPGRENGRQPRIPAAAASRTLASRTSRATGATAARSGSRPIYDNDHGLDAALAVNEGSTAPHYYSGPIWAIFDQAAVERRNWKLRYPLRRRQRLLLQGRHDRGARREDRGRQPVPARAARASGRDGRHLEPLRGRRRRSRLRAGKGRADAPDREAAVLRARDHGRRGTTPTAACASTGASRSSTCRARSSRVCTRVARPRAGSTSTASARAPCRDTSPARTPRRAPRARGNSDQDFWRRLRRSLCRRRLLAGRGWRDDALQPQIDRNSPVHLIAMNT